MAIRIPWDKYEAAILLDGLLEIKENNTSKTSVVKRISKQLREMALNKGIVIDDIFRNENGISFQLQSMNSAYENTNNGKPSTKLFDEIVYIYRTNRNSYEQILREAQSMISNTKKNQSAFFSFVESKEPKRYNNIFVAMSAINDFAIKTKVVDSSIYNDLSESLIGLLNKKVIRNKFFVVKNKKNMLYAELGLKLFHMYITENNLANIVPDDAVSTTKGYDGGDEFIEWMINERSLSKSTAKSYRSALNTCNDYAHKNGIYKNSIISCESFEEYISMYELIANDLSFIEFNNAQHGYLIAALKKHHEFMREKSGNQTDCQQKSNQSISSELANECNLILSNNFEDGYRLRNYMHQMRFISYFEDSYEKELHMTGNELDVFLKKIGRVIDDRVFASDNENSSNLFNELYIDIQNAFDRGASVVFLECLFEKYNQRLASEMSIYDEETLRTVLKKEPNFPVGFSIGKLVITMHGRNKDVNEEIRNVLKNSHTPLTYEEIQSSLWYIPLNKIKISLNQIPDAAYVDSSSYFYAPNFNISPEELARLVNALHDTLYSKGFVVAKELREIFREYCPLAAMDSEEYKDYAIREILKVLLRDKFNFSSSVITELGTNADIGSVYENYVSERDNLTLTELKAFENEIGVSVYWYNVMKHMIRISETEFVNKRLVSFDIAAVDNVLESLCPNDYVALKDVKLFLSFPHFSYQWNGYVLESFLRDYSMNFKLIQLSISSDSFMGIMLKKTSALKTYEDVAADMLARNTNWIDEKTALKCLVNAGFQQRAANKNISSIIKLAKQIRETNE